MVARRWSRIGSVTACSMGSPSSMRPPNPIENKGDGTTARPAPLRDDKARGRGLADHPVARTLGEHPADGIEQRIHRNRLEQHFVGTFGEAALAQIDRSIG